MSNEKEMLVALYKIAKNQQKIINKLAQERGLDVEDPEAGGASASWDDVTESVKANLRSAALGAGLKPEDARLVSDSVVYKTKDMKGQLRGVVAPVPPAKKDLVVNNFKNLVLGKSLKTNDGKNSEVVKQVVLEWT